jgi:hypothetical protein
MCGVFGMLWGEEKCMQGFGAEMWRKEACGWPRHGWEDSIKIGWDGVEWIHVARGKEQCWVVVLTVLSLLVL